MNEMPLSIRLVAGAINIVFWTAVLTSPTDYQGSARRIKGSYHEIAMMTSVHGLTTGFRYLARQLAIVQVVPDKPSGMVATLGVGGPSRLELRMSVTWTDTRL